MSTDNLHPTISRLRDATDPEIMANLDATLRGLPDGGGEAMPAPDYRFLARMRKRWEATDGDLPLQPGERNRILTILSEAMRRRDEAAAQDDLFNYEDYFRQVEEEADAGIIPEAKEEDIDLSLINADRDIVDLLDRLPAVGKGSGLRLLLCGPPGTGKSLLGRHLAKCLKMPAQIVQVGNVLHMNVGQTENNIAQMFQDSTRRGTFLIVDEVDSFLFSRAGATKSWEVTGVNAFLTAMDAHPLPLVATTNFVESLDQAAGRRFLFRLDLDYLTLEQVAHAFRLFFGIDPPAEVLELAQLTPADLDLVRRRAVVLGTLGDANWIAKELRNLKPETRSSKIRFGFHA